MLSMAAGQCCLPAKAASSTHPSEELLELNYRINRTHKLASLTGAMSTDPPDLHAVTGFTILKPTFIHIKAKNQNFEKHIS